jgi:hypothetical protein
VRVPLPLIGRALLAGRRQGCAGWGNITTFFVAVGEPSRSDRRNDSKATASLVATKKWVRPQRTLVIERCRALRRLAIGGDVGFTLGAAMSPNTGR